ncbi:cysteine desulfurase family protein [Suttonella ornithocola]|uniref:cysteine desulfurase n=1 Tax=Suttonella ornithocola TaxID=279832 RepID=A0A380MVT8_9GAMM|nr:cysteine desulfurase family protein [Suttonella ornithocola]SUO95517.1 Cysteine desulfurase [Suttonella ornithocola]
MSSAWAYFDYTATTPIAPEVLSVYTQALQADWYNSGATYEPALAVRKQIETARAKLAEQLGIQASEMVFTSGATEANNLAIKGAVEYHGAKLPRVITVQTEHKAVLDTVGVLAKRGVPTEFLPVKSTGLLDLSALEAALQARTTLVSVMAVNNETGVIQPIREIADLVHRYGAKLHVDAAQALGKIPISIKDWDADAVSFSGHKVYAPKGIGALYVRRLPKMRLQAQLHGGGQERGRRSGTLPAALIMAFSSATQQAIDKLSHRRALVQQLARALVQNLPTTMQLNTTLENTRQTPHILSIHTHLPVSEVLRVANAAKIALSAGSACQSSDTEGSHVLSAMGKIEASTQSIRVSLSHLTTMDELERLIGFLWELK